MEKDNSIIMLLTGDPARDTRVRREAASAGKRFDVTIIGMSAEGEDQSEGGEVEGCRVAYAQRKGIPLFEYIGLVWKRLFGAGGRVAFLIGLCVGFVLAVPLLVVFPVLLFARRLFSIFPGMKRIYHIPGFRWIFFVWAVKNNIQYTVGLVRAFEARIDRADIIHSNDLDTLLAGVLIRSQRKAALVYDAHELWPVQDPFAPWYHVAVFRWFEGRLIGRADEVLTVSKPLAEIFQKWYGLERISVLPNVLPYTERREPPGGEMSRIAGDRVKFLYHGGFLPGRGIDTLLRLWSRVDAKKAVLFLRGGDNPYKKELEELAKKIIPEGGAYFIDAVPLDDVIPAAMEADVGVIPYEPLCLNNEFACPNKLSEYMQAGLCVLANGRLVNIRNTINAFDCGVSYNPKDEDGTLAVIEELISNSSLRSRLRENAREASRAEYNWAGYESVLLDAYRRVISP